MDGSELAASIAADRPARPPPTTITVGTSMLQNGRKMKRRRAREQEEMQRMIFFSKSEYLYCFVSNTVPPRLVHPNLGSSCYAALLKTSPSLHIAV